MTDKYLYKKPIQEIRWVFMIRNYSDSNFTFNLKATSALALKLNGVGEIPEALRVAVKQRLLDVLK